MKEKFVVTIPVYKSGNTKLLNYVSEINCNTLIVPQISSVRTDPSSLAYHINQKYNKSVIITINTVDTNLRFIQSRILGAELFKLNNFLITKGDAKSLQKSPIKQTKDSKAVYEHTTTNVMNSIKQMNKGYDFIGNKLESNTECVFGSTIEINQTDKEYLNLINKKIKELQAEYDAREYARNRKPEYPDIGDQLDDLYHKGAFSDEMAVKIKAVKDAHPKPE